MGSPLIELLPLVVSRGQAAYEADTVRSPLINPSVREANNPASTSLVDAKATISCWNSPSKMHHG